MFCQPSFSRPEKVSLALGVLYQEDEEKNETREEKVMQQRKGSCSSDCEISLPI